MAWEMLYLNHSNPCTSICPICQALVPYERRRKHIEWHLEMNLSFPRENRDDAPMLQALIDIEEG